MIKSIFSGDPLIKITENGATMKLVDGQPIMDQGLENAVLISLFTKPGWWGNALIRDINKQIGSNFERQRTIVDLETINNVIDDATLALEWMKDVRLSNKIEINVTNPYMNQIHVSIKIYPPGKDAQEFIFTDNGINWISQAINPAHERFN